MKEEINKMKEQEDTSFHFKVGISDSVSSNTPFLGMSEWQASAATTYLLAAFTVKSARFD